MRCPSLVLRSVGCVMCFVVFAYWVLRVLPFVPHILGCIYLFYVACIMPFLVHGDGCDARPVRRRSV